MNQEIVDQHGVPGGDEGRVRRPPRRRATRSQMRGLVLGVASLLVAGCLGVPVREGRGRSVGPGVEEVNVEAVSFGFVPNQIRVRAGREVRLRVRNTSFVKHNFTLLSPDGKVVKEVDIEGGGAAVVSFRAPSAGRYTIYCDRFLHRKMGMEGFIEVR